MASTSFLRLSPTLSLSICSWGFTFGGALQVLQAYLKTIPYTANTAYEGHYQQVLYIIFTLMGYYVNVEVHTSTGRVDMVMKTKDTFISHRIEAGQECRGCHASD